MQLSEFDYSYPEELVAIQPQPTFRILYSNSEAKALKEINKTELFDLFQAGDALVINETKVLKRRVFTEDGMGVLFVENNNHPLEWKVLYPARDSKIGDHLKLKGQVTLELVSKGLPQIVRASQPLDDNYFLEHGEYALPPYIQKARENEHNLAHDEEWYQTAWAREPGSCAAPTASLHFTQDDLQKIEARGVKILKVTLHVGIGTFLPVKTQNLNDHVMHKEWAYIPGETLREIQNVKSNQKKVWGLGTTVARTLESQALGLLKPQANGAYSGETDLFIRPGFEWQVVDVLMTNFHQPKSTLLALVAAFASLDHVKKAYQYAIENKFRLFSYGDLSVWVKK